MKDSYHEVFNQILVNLFDQGQFDINNSFVEINQNCGDDLAYFLLWIRIIKEYINLGQIFLL